MFKLKDPNIKFPEPYPTVERVDPSVDKKGYDKVGEYKLRDKIDFMPQKGLQEKLCACDSNLIFLAGAASMGKEQPYDAKVLTPNGFVKMGSLSVGDIISTRDGGEQVVEAIFEQGLKDVWELTFDDGSKTECGLNHLWLVSVNWSAYRVMEFSDILDLYDDEANIRIPGYRDRKEKYISTVRYIDRKLCRCIRVSSPDHLYITDDYIVTHNTYSMMLKGLQGIDKPGFTGRFISVRLQDSKKGSSVYRDGVEVWGNFADCEYSSSDYPTFSWPRWNSNIQLIHSNFNVDNPAEWDAFKDYAKKNQSSYIAIDEATEISSFKMFSYWFSRNRDSSGMKPCMVLSFNPEHEHWTTQMLKDAGYLGDDWFIKPEMNGVTRYFYIKGDDAESIIWGDSAEVVAAAAGIRISEKERRAGITVHQIVKTFTFFTGDAADNLKLISATGGENIGNLHAVGSTQRSILHGGYFGPVENEELKVSRRMIQDLWVNPYDEDQNVYATLDVSGGTDTSDGCPMVIWKGHTIIAIKWFYGDSKELVDWINDNLQIYDIKHGNFAFDATGMGFYLKAYSDGVAVTSNMRPVQEIDELGNPVTMEQYFNLRSQLLGKMRVMLEKGEISCTIDKNESMPYGRKGERRAFIDSLYDQMALFACTTRNKRIYYKSKDEFKQKYHYSPDLMDAIVLRARFDLDGRPKKQPDIEIDDDAYTGIYNSYSGGRYYL